MKYTPPIGGAANDPYVDANPATGVEGSPVPAAAIEHPQREIANVIIGAGLTPDVGDLTQLRLAIQKMIISGQQAVVVENAVFEASVTTGEAVRWDATNSRYDEAVADGTANNLAVGFADVAEGKVYLYGECPAFSGLTPGARYYLSAGSGGAITTVAPSDTVMVGIAKNETTLFVDIDASQSQSAASIQGAFKNLTASATGTNATVSVSADGIVVEDASNAYKTLRAVSLSINSAASGASGLDTGSLAANTWYSVWVIWNGTTTAGLLSASATAPTMPSGYTYKARVGWVRTDSTANKYPLAFTQCGRKVRYKVGAGTNVAALPIMASGSAGSISTPTWVAVAWGAFAPSTAAALGVLMASASGLSTICAPSNAYGAAASWTNPPPLNGRGPSGYPDTDSYDMPLESSNIFWASDSSGALFCYGWEDNL